MIGTERIPSGQAQARGLMSDKIRCEKVQEPDLSIEMIHFATGQDSGSMNGMTRFGTGRVRSARERYSAAGRLQSSGRPARDWLASPQNEHSTEAWPPDGWAWNEGP
jgi:hypothetical protein